MDSLSTVIKTSNDNSSKSMFNDDVEISIFDAEKYFNEELNDIKRQHHVEKKPSHDLLSSPAAFGRQKSLRAATPSEASWNSQTALLAAANHRTSKTWSAAKKWFFRRKYFCCSNGKSIRVKEVITSDTRPTVLMDSVKTSNRNPKILHADADRSHKHDDVVEIHQIRATEAPSQQRISATGRPFINATVGFTFPILNSATGCGKEDDVGSDSSSDLFEIETFSTQTMSFPIHCLCDSVDGDSNGETKFMPANGVGNVHRSRLSECRPAATADGCDGELEQSVAALRPPREEGGGRRRKSDGGTMPVGCRTAAAEGPAAIPLRVGGRPLQAEKPRRGRSRSPPLLAAGG